MPENYALLSQVLDLIENMDYKTSLLASPFTTNLFTQIQSPFKFEMHLSGPISTEIKLWLQNLFLNLNRDEAVFSAYLLQANPMLSCKFPWENPDFLQSSPIQIPPFLQ